MSSHQHHQQHRHQQPPPHQPPQPPNFSAALSNQETAFRNRLRQKDEEIAKLRDRVAGLSGQLQLALQQQRGTPESKKKEKKKRTLLSPEAFQVRVNRGGAAAGAGGGNRSSRLGGGGGSLESFAGGGSSGQQQQHHRVGTGITTQRQRLGGRNASIATNNALSKMHAEKELLLKDEDRMLDAVCDRVMKMFQNPAQDIAYLNSEEFRSDLKALARKVRHILEREPRVLFLESPCYVFGDIHGNLEDLHFFSDNMWRLGMELTAGTFLFLGDYVDRGLSCLECTAYLFAMKCQSPAKIHLLRGNHETRDVNGWEEHYGERSFISQCVSRFGNDHGYDIWERCNQVFDRMPLSAVVDQDIFCVHGGIPRPLSPDTTRIQDILTVSRVAGINPPYQHEDERYQQVASDCIWSDPAGTDQERTTVDPNSGFGQSLRGGGAICFGNKAVTDFLQENGFSYILRAHEAHAEGVAVSKGARVFTVFSTSKDHNQGDNAMAGCILVDQDRLQVINRSPAYKNQYVHRRDSMTVAALPPHEIENRMRLGLVTAAAATGGAAQHYAGAADDGDAEELVDQWQDFEMEEDEDEGADTNIGSAKDDESGADNASSDNLTEEEDFVFDKSRRSSVDLSTMSQNTHDDTQFVDEYAQQRIAMEHHQQPGGVKRPKRSSQPSIASIDEEAAMLGGEGSNGKENDIGGGDDDDEEVATVDGDDHDVELRDATD